MKYQRKTFDTWHMESNYGYGWDIEHATETWKEMRQSLKEYRENFPKAQFRAHKRRVQINSDCIARKVGMRRDINNRYDVQLENILDALVQSIAESTDEEIREDARLAGVEIDVPIKKSLSKFLNQQNSGVTR